MTAMQSFPLSFRVPIGPHWDGNPYATDLFAPVGTPWLAVFSGNASAYDVPLGGHALTLTSDDGSTSAYYAHGNEPGISGHVEAGQVIGHVGTSGNAEGKPPHLHFAVGQIQSDGSGTIDPRVFLSGGDSPAGLPVGVLVAAGALAVGWYVFG